MSWYGKLVSGVAAVATSVVKATRAVSGALGAGLAALASVGSRVVEVVKAGWEYARPAVEKVRDVVVTAVKAVIKVPADAAKAAVQFTKDVRSEIRRNLGDHSEALKDARDAENARKQQDFQAAAQALSAAKDAEATARKAKAETAAREAEAEAEARRQDEIDEAMRARFVELTRDLAEQLKRLLSQSQIMDFGAYLKTRTCADLVVALSQDARGLAGFRQLVEDDVALPVASIQALANGEELLPEEWATLEELCQRRFEKSLVERSGEQLFVLWTGEQLDLDKKLHDISAAVSDAKVAVAMVDQKRKAGVDVNETDLARAAMARQRLAKLEEERTAAHSRLDDLLLLTGVAEGLLRVLVGEEVDQIEEEDVAEASTLVVGWSQGKQLITAQREFLQQVAMLYRARARTRAERVRDEVYVAA